MSRRPTPTHLHKLAGSFRADRHRTMTLTPGTPPDAPGWLSSIAKAKWVETAAALAAAGALTALDLDALAAYCECYATWREALETVRREGATFPTRSGLVKRHPAVAIVAQAGRELLAWSDKLGLTPAARQRMRFELPATEEADEFEALLNGE